MPTQAAETHDFDFDLLMFPLVPQEAALQGFRQLVRVLLVAPLSLVAAALLLLVL